MIPIRRIAVVLLAAVALVGALTFSARAGDEKRGGGRPLVQLMTRTWKVYVHAAHAVKKGGEGKDELRKAWIHQKASRWAFRARKPFLAARLSLSARVHARKAIQANKQTVPAEESTDTPEETKQCEGSTEAEAAAALAEAEKGAPSAEEVAKEEPKEEMPAPEEAGK